MTTDVNLQSLANSRVGALFGLRHRVLPFMSLGIAIIANAIWVGFLGYWLVRLFL